MNEKIIVFTKYASPAFQRILSGVMYRHALARSWRIQVVETGRVGCDPMEAVAVAKPDGILVYGAHGGQTRLSGVRVPSVYVNPLNPKGFRFSVVHDSDQTGVLAAREFFRLGLVQVGFVGWEVPAQWSIRRQAAFVRESEACGSACSVFDGRWRVRAPAQSVKSVADWLSTIRMPCGVFAANDEVGEMVLSAAAKVGLSVPGDVAVIGVDDNERLCENTSPTLSSVRQDSERGGQLAAELLDELMSGECRAARRLSYGDIGIVRRMSTQRLALTAPGIPNALEFIRREALSGISAEDVIGRLDMARRTAEIAFRRATGHSIVDEIQSVRLAAVRELLRNPAIAISSIPSRVGYVSENFLARLFKRVEGMTMREWRVRAIG